MNPNKNEKENQNTIYSWATGRLASLAIGLAVGVFIYKSGIIQNLTGKFFTKKETPKNQTNTN